LLGAQCKLNQSMKTIIQIHKEGKYYVAVDLVTNVADQGLTGAGSKNNFKSFPHGARTKAKNQKTSFLDIEADCFLS